MNKKYDIVYMDPPWAYHFGGPMSSGSSIEKHYNTMTHQEMLDLTINDITNDDSLIYMWTTSTHIEKAIQLGNHWGFDYKVMAFVWDKVRPVTGYYTMGQCEYVLCFKKKGGRIPKPRGTRGCRQILTETKREHSRKPDEIRRRIEEMHPEQTKLEMFARTQSLGWDVWGNEVDKFDQNNTQLF